MKDHLADARYSVDHAKRRIVEFDQELRAFLDSKPCRWIVERDEGAGQDVHKLKLVKPVPPSLKGIAFDVVGNLRAALDQAGYAVAIAVGKKGGDAHFPFGKDAKSKYAVGKGRSKDIPQNIFDTMFAFQPYQGGNDVLFALNKLSNTHKHEVVVSSELASGSMKVTNIGHGVSLVRSPWDSARNEMEFARTAIGKEDIGDFEFQIKVLYGDVDVVRGMQVGDVLQSICDEVERVLLAVEAEATRTGVFK